MTNIQEQINILKQFLIDQQNKFEIEKLKKMLYKLNLVLNIENTIKIATANINMQMTKSILILEVVVLISL